MVHSKEALTGTLLLTGVGTISWLQLGTTLVVPVVNLCIVQAVAKGPSEK